MDTVSFPCPACGATVKAPVTLAGRVGKCPKCEERVEIPAVHPTGVGSELGDEASVDAREEAEPAPQRPRAASGARRVPRARPSEVRSENPSLAIGAAAGGAVAGALIWAAVSYFTNYESGWIAWGVGGLVGGATRMVGGRGTTIAVAAAAFALFGIFAGKVLGFQLAVGKAGPEIRQQWIDEGAEESYEEMEWDARGLVELEDPGDDSVLAEFLDEHGFEGVTPADFRENFEADLREFHVEQPTFDEWLDAAVAEALGDISPMELAIGDLQLIDILFAFFGVATAFGLVMKATQEQALQEARTARAAARDGDPDA